jgi:hypothetical protein
MKKVGLGLISLLVIAAIYYFTIGSEKIVKEIKMQVNTHLIALEKEGFSIEERKIEENKEHFVISFDDSKKISSFLYQQGMQITAEDAKVLKGLKIGIDAHYLPDTLSLITFDMYPVALPVLFTSSTNSDNKKVLAELQKMLDKKTFLMHIAISKTGSGFTGYMKDINETIEDELVMNAQLKSLQFEGNIKENRIHSVKQTLDNFSVQVSDEMKITFSNVESNYRITGKTLYDYTTHYSIDDIISSVNGLNVAIKNIDAISTSIVADNIASGTFKTTIEHTHISDEKEPYDLENFVFEIKASNVDMTAMNTLQNADLSDEKVMNALLTQLFSKGVQFEISTLSLESIEYDGQLIEGFNLTSQVLLDKDFDMLALENNPLSALETVNADLNLMFSKELFELMAQQPQAMMALMMFQPQDENNKKVYKLELKDGELFVNGAPVM